MQETKTLSKAVQRHTRVRVSKQRLNGIFASIMIMAGSMQSYHAYLAHASLLPIHHACMDACSSQPLHLSVCTLLPTTKPSHATHFRSLSDKVAGLAQSPCRRCLARLATATAHSRSPQQASAHNSPPPSFLPCPANYQLPTRPTEPTSHQHQALVLCSPAFRTRQYQR